MLLIRLTIDIFYHLFDTNNLIGNHCMEKDFSFPALCSLASFVLC